MGVTGLWKLIEPCGKPVPVETLEGKILAIDISIWLHQVIKGFQDSKGSALPNAHLLGLFNRLCKLLYYRVKPVFVFDGCVPQLKRETIARRQQQRSKLNTEAERIQALLLQSLAKEKVVQQALGANAELLLKSPSKRPGGKTSTRDDVDDMFKLPELPASSKKRDQLEGGDDSNDCYDSSFTSLNSNDDYSNTSADDSSSFDESNARHSYNANLQAIDVKSQHFRNLPADVRHEILVDIKETRKQSSWGRLHELPSKSDDFSTFQMKRLLKRRAVQESLETAEQEMGGRTLTFAELNNLFTEEGILEKNVLEKGSKPICSDEHTRFLLVRDLKKKLTKTESTEETQEPSTPASISTSTVAKEEIKVEVCDKEKEKVDKSKELGEEFDTELQLALAMSLEGTQVYDQKDYKYESNEQIKLNRDQRKRLQNAAVGPARAYMIEFGGLNEEEVEGIMDKTQGDNCFENSILSSDFIIEESIPNEKQIEKETLDISCDVSESQEIRLHMSEDSETDTDLEEVDEAMESPKIDLKKTETKKPLEIVLDLKENVTEEEDLFADVFNTEELKLVESAESGISMSEAGNKDEIIILESQESEKPKLSETEIQNKTTIPESQKSQNSMEIQMANNDDVIVLDSQDSIKPVTDSKTTTPKVDANAILSSLKSQLDEIKNINLDDIKINSNIIELSDEECAKNQIETPRTPVKSEVIEICDSDDGVPTTLVSKSPNLKTPTKNRSISEYFSTDYVVKRTPEKVKEEDEDVPKVKSPFFVKRTPKSSRKRNDKSESPTPTKKQQIVKASKSLFETMTEDETKAMDPQNDGVEPLKLTPVNTEDLINEAAQILKENKTEEELQTIAKDLAKERKNLESERNRQDRMGMSISQRMSSECQELLGLFGIPYIIAPMEAEAQCAFLDSVELTNGTITDDSDIWLFGGRTVYKNFFAQNKHVLEFRSEKIENTFSCDRTKLIQLACLVGSDYTTGVHGIGAVTALEILASFTPSNAVVGKDYLSKGNENMREMITAAIATLSKFRDWWLTHKAASMPPGTSARLALRKKLKNIELHEGFPSLAVVEAYLSPKIDDSRDAFSWGYPDVESIREYAKKTFGWTSLKTNEILMPVLKKLDEKKSQATLRNYFAVKSAISVRQLKVSKRVQKAIDRMSGQTENETPEKPAKPTKKRATRGKKKETKDLSEQAESDNKNDVEMVNDEDSKEKELLTEEPSTSQKPTRATRKRLAPDLHSRKSELIPQREKDKAKMEESKAKAAEVLKKMAKTETTTKKKRKS